VNILLGGKLVTTERLRQIGFMLVDLAGKVDRYHVQLEQSKAAPGDMKERAEADRAATRAMEGMQIARRVMAEYLS
jgi:hypothetical protein